MTRAKRVGSLRDIVRTQGFTPSVRDVDELLDLLAGAEDGLARDVERALVRLGPALVPAMQARLGTSEPRLRAHLVRLLGRGGARDPAVVGALIEALGDTDPKTRRHAAAALGKAGGDAAERALLAAWERETGLAQRRALAEALGKTGGPASLTLLRSVRENDPELARIIARATLMIERTHVRARPSAIDARRAPAEPASVMFHCRAGLERTLCGELGRSWHPRVVASTRVAATLRGPLASMFAARTALRFALCLSPERLRPGETTAAALVRALSSDEALAVFRQFTRGAIRYRIAWESGGHRRALVWECARQIAAARPELVNDPTRSTWEALVREVDDVLEVELVPRALDDPRFVYRLETVPAASHPTLAAALARIAAPRREDVVWDPFVGSGGELIECALLGRCRALVGSDTDARAIAASARNVRAAGLGSTVQLFVGDATAVARPGITLIITNPPMGRRVVHHAELGALLDRFLDHSARVLGKGGRLVWISPLPERTAARALRVGYGFEFAQFVDMGGFSAQIQVLRRTR